MLFMIDNIHNERGTYYTDSTLPGYYIMSVVCILYRYQDSALNHMIGGLKSSPIFTIILFTKPMGGRGVKGDRTIFTKSVVNFF